MTNDDLINYISSIGLETKTITGKDHLKYIVNYNYQIKTGILKGKICDVAIQYMDCIPYIPPSAIHTRPAIVPMDMIGILKTQQSNIDVDWQYWSRRLSIDSPNPKLIFTRIATIFNEVSL